jgi:Flp pilus assembly protein TadD
VPIQILAAAAKVAERAEKNPTPRNLHDLGVANILAGEPDAAISALESVVNAEPSSARLVDLAAAFLTRGHEDDVQRALEAATKAWTMERTPSAAWNRALALERLGRNQDAVAAWSEYLALDPSSEWSSEAKQRIADLQLR